jgi:hypothetical protein
LVGKSDATAYGYTLMVNGRRERTVHEEWTKDDALAELVKRQAEVSAGKVTRPEARTLGQLRDEYLAYKRDHKKRSLHEDVSMLNTRLMPAFGADLPVKKLTAPAIAQYEKHRAGQVSAFTVANEVGVPRHMLQLGKKWGTRKRVARGQRPSMLVIALPTLRSASGRCCCAQSR